MLKTQYITFHYLIPFLKLIKILSKDTVFDAVKSASSDKYEIALKNTHEINDY